MLYVMCIRIGRMSLSSATSATLTLWTNDTGIIRRCRGLIRLPFVCNVCHFFGVGRLAEGGEYHRYYLSWPSLIVISYSGWSHEIGTINAVYVSDEAVDGDGFFQTIINIREHEASHAYAVCCYYGRRNYGCGQLRPCW